MAVNCAGSYCFCSPDDYQGNQIFEEINTKLINENDNLSEETKENLERCEQLLKESEEQRRKIADKFKELLVDTGACVIRKPTLERAAITYIIYLIEQIIISAKDKTQIFTQDDFSISNFISIKDERPFFSLNQDALDNIKSKYEFDKKTEEQISKGKTSLINFLSTAFDIQNTITNQANKIGDLLKKINLKSLIEIKDSISKSLKFLINYCSELSTSIFLVQSQLTNPKRIELFFKIANDAAKKGITDPKEFALRYSLGETCGKIDDWEENICYKKIEILKY